MPKIANKQHILIAAYFALLLIAIYTVVNRSMWFDCRFTKVDFVVRYPSCLLTPFHFDTELLEKLKNILFGFSIILVPAIITKSLLYSKTIILSIVLIYISVYLCFTVENFYYQILVLTNPAYSLISPEILHLITGSVTRSVGDSVIIAMVSHLVIVTIICVLNYKW